MKKPKPRVWTTKVYDRVSGFYDAFMSLFFPISKKGWESITSKLTSGSVLDVACGSGSLLKLANQKGLDCCGVDLSGGMLAQARKKVATAGLVRASYYELPYAEQSFDHVVATNALSGEYIDAGKALQEILRVCREGGWVYIAEWPKAEQDTVGERLVVWLARLNEDAPKDYLTIFRAMGYEPEVDVLNKRYHIFGCRK